MTKVDESAIAFNHLFALAFAGRYDKNGEGHALCLHVMLVLHFLYLCCWLCIDAKVTQAKVGSLQS